MTGVVLKDIFIYDQEPLQYIMYKLLYFKDVN